MGWDFACDMLIVGSGGGALTGAYVAASEGLDVLVIESTDRFGGTTCYSGGAVWLPGNQASARAGLDDTNEIALDYFQRVVGDRTPRELQRAFVRNGPNVVEYLERSPHIDFSWFAFPDYYGDIGCPPGHARGRDILTAPLPVSEAGEFAGKVRSSMPQDIGGEPEPDFLGGGRALVGRLLLACRDAKVRFLLNCELQSLIVEDGRVVGGVANRESRPIRIHARRGVLMAAGGFERNQQMRDEFGVAGSSEWSCGAPGGTGKAIRAGMAIGAATDLMSECWWMPGLIQPNGRTGFIAAVNGGIIVNGAGERFGNETGPYDRFGRKMRAGQATGVDHIPAWWIWDASLGPTVPSAAISMPVRDFETYAAADLWKRGETLADLACEIGVPADGLSATVARFNGFCETGIDADFHRGETPYDIYIARELPAVMGRDPVNPVGSPNPCLIPIETGPFYAAKIGLGDLGSKGGLKTDANSRVLRADGSFIPGLYAAGDTMAAAAGEAYPAPGTPIGSCMVFFVSGGDGYGFAIIFLSRRPIAKRELFPHRRYYAKLRKNMGDSMRGLFGLLALCVVSVVTPAHAAPPPIEAYGKLPAVGMVTLSPKGDRVAFITTTGEDRALAITQTDGKSLGGGVIGSTKVTGVSWASEDIVLIEVYETSPIGFRKINRFQDFVFNVRTGKIAPLVSLGRSVNLSRTLLGAVRTTVSDDHTYAWLAAYTFQPTKTLSYINENAPDFYRVDLNTGDLQLTAHGHLGIQSWLVGPGGQILARSFYDDKASIRSILLGQEGDHALAAVKAPFGNGGGLYLGRTPDSILVELPAGSDGKATTFREFGLAGSANPMPDTSSMDMPLFDPVSRLWVGEILLNDDQEPLFFSSLLEGRWRGTRKAFPNNFVHLVSWSADFNRLVVQTDGGDDAGTYWLVDIAQHSADPIGSPYPLVKSADVGPVRMIDWRAADGLPLHGVLTTPPGRDVKSLPLVVLPHGGPEARDYPGFDWWAQAFASRGYAVFQPNFRGSDGYGEAFRNAGFGEWGRKMQTDISDGVAELARRGIVDPKRACIVGASYGGYAALAGVTVQQGLYRCAVSVAGIADLSDFMSKEFDSQGAQSSALRYWRDFLGVTGNLDSRLKEISPSELAGRADAPILLIHGKDDTVVPIEQSKIMESALKRAGKPVEFVRMENEGHWLTSEATRIQMLQAAVAFVQKNNPAN